jgi:hypothetical protein
VKSPVKIIELFPAHTGSNFNRTKGAILLLLVIGIPLISACAGMAKGVDTSVYAKRGTSTEFESVAPGSAALVVIRYPAMVHADVENLYFSSFAINSIGGTAPQTVYGQTLTARVAPALLAKSSYFAMSLYEELKQVLPEGSVLLSPHIIVWDDERKMHSRPILASEQIPSALIVDFNVYSYPDATEMMESPPLTFGDLVTPLITVKSNRWLNPALNGLLISSEPLTESAWRQNREHSDRLLQNHLYGSNEDRFTSLEFVSFLGERNQAPGNAPDRSVGQSNGHKFSIEQYPLEKIRMDGEVISNLVENFPQDPFVPSFARGMSNRIVNLLSSIDLDRATYLDRQAAISRFDPELGNVFFLQSMDESVRARLQLAEALIEAERRFLVAQSDSLYQGTYLGSFGTKMRKVIESEYRLLEERRHLARVQNMAAAVASIALAGTVYGATLTTSASALAVSSLTGLSLVGAIWGMNEAVDSRAESEQVSEYFGARMAPTFQQQMSVQMEWLESKEVITARGFAEFRNKTLSLYQARVRSLAVQAGSQCNFLHPGFSAPGRWYGACLEGNATGNGYGVTVDEKGSNVEYLGYTRDGLAWGNGAMILRNAGQSGSTFLEGEFAEGRPNGVVKVEETGKPLSVRRYRTGEDIGKGEAGSLQKMSFSSNWSETTVLNP